MSKRATRREEMFTLTKLFLSSNQTQVDFCVDNNLKLATFSYWLKQYRMETGSTDAPGFIALQPIVRSGLEIRLPNGILISLSDFSGDLTSLVKGLCAHA